MYCKNCIYWGDEHPTNGDAPVKGGKFCLNPKLNESGMRRAEFGYAIDALSYPYNENGYFWTGPNFGCVHFKSEFNNSNLEVKPSNVSIGGYKKNG